MGNEEKIPRDCNGHPLRPGQIVRTNDSASVLGELQRVGEEESEITIMPNSRPGIKNVFHNSVLMVIHDVEHPK